MPATRTAKKGRSLRHVAMKLPQNNYCDPNMVVTPGESVMDFSNPAPVQAPMRAPAMPVPTQGPPSYQQLEQQVASQGHATVGPQYQLNQQQFSVGLQQLPTPPDDLCSGEALNPLFAAHEVSQFVESYDLNTNSDFRLNNGLNPLVAVPMDLSAPSLTYPPIDPNLTALPYQGNPLPFTNAPAEDGLFPDWMDGSFDPALMASQPPLPANVPIRDIVKEPCHCSSDCNRFLCYVRVPGQPLANYPGDNGITVADPAILPSLPPAPEAPPVPAPTEDFLSLPTIDDIIMAAQPSNMLYYVQDDSPGLFMGYQPGKEV